MSTQGEIVAYVRSKNVPSYSETYGRLSYTGSGSPIRESRRVFAYKQVLDDTQQKMVEDAKRLASSLGAAFREVDMAGSSPLKKLVDKVLHNYPKAPSVHFDLHKVGGIDMTSLEEVVSRYPSMRLELGQSS